MAKKIVIKKRVEPEETTGKKLGGLIAKKRDMTVAKTSIDPAKLKVRLSFTKKRTITTRNNNTVITQLTGAGGNQLMDNITPVTNNLNEDHCFSYEEVKGMKVESPVIISNPSDMSNILPGAVFSGNDLIDKGKFVYQKMKFRNPISLRTPPSNIVKNTVSQAIPKNGEDITGKLGNATAQLMSSNNFNKDATPNTKSDLESIETSIEDYLSLSIATSGFFMGISGENNFKFSSSEKKYFYMFGFEQECLSIIADQIKEPKDVFTDGEDGKADWFYIEQVQYGRRLHILVESNQKLERFSAKQAGELNWGVVGGEFSVEEKGSSFFKQININALAIGGAQFSERDPKKIDAAIKAYFAVPFNKFSIVPLSFTITDLYGTPVCLKTEAFLNEKKCLDTDKIRIRLKSIEVITDDDGARDRTEQLFGQVSIYVYNEKKKQVFPDGKEMDKNLAALKIPSAGIKYGSEDNPIRIKSGYTIDDTSSILKNKYVDMKVSNLNFQIKFRPIMKEEDDITDDVFKNHSGDFNMTLRQMLQQGVFSKTFYFNDGKSEAELTVEVSPL